MKDRPGGRHTIATTPEAHAMSQIIRGHCHGGVTVTDQEYRNLHRLYGYVPEKPNAKPEPPPPLPPNADWKAENAHKNAVDAHARWTDPRPFLQAGADLHAMRHAEADGLRLVAWLARYTEPGEDPLKLLVRMASDAGFDVSPGDYGWATDEEKEPEEA